MFLFFHRSSAIEKLHSCDNAFRKQLEKQKEIYEREIDRLTREKEEAVSQSNIKVKVMNSQGTWLPPIGALRSYMSYSRRLILEPGRQEIFPQILESSLRQSLTQIYLKLRTSLLNLSLQLRKAKVQEISYGFCHLCRPQLIISLWSDNPMILISYPMFQQLPDYMAGQCK